VIPRHERPPDYLLPPSAYFDAGWWEREQQALFSDRWALVASAHVLRQRGDYVARDVGRVPLVVVVGEDGELRAFHNVCRHRGMALLAGTGRVEGSVNCFYHQWRYGLDGELQVVPQRKEEFPDLVACDWGLLPASVALWEGLVFTHPDPDAEPLIDALAGIDSLDQGGFLGSHRPGQLHELAVLHLDARCNWKLFVENHIDVYHLWYLHAGTLGDYDHTRFEHHQVGANWVSYEPFRSADRAEATRAAGTIQITHLNERDRYGLGAHLAFPNLMMATSAEFFATYVAEPVGPERSMIELRIRGEAEADVGRLRSLALAFINEDIQACEAIQRSIRSPAFRVGPLAHHHERPIETFQRNVLQRLGLDGGR